MSDLPDSPKPPASSMVSTMHADEPLDAPTASSEANGGQLDASTRRYLLRNLAYLVVGIVALVALAATAEHLFGAEVQAASSWLTHKGGYPGVALAIWLIDTFTVPMSPDVVLAFVAHSGSSLNHALALTVICIASVLAGNSGYYLARWLSTWSWLRRRLERSFDKGHALFARFGVWAVVIAGLTPVPFSVVCWLAGVYRMSPGRLFLATFSRVPRFVGWYYLIRLGFSL